MSHYPERIVCLTEETTETLYLLNEDWRIVGISGFTTRPERARREKPIVSSFTKARIDDIKALEPDLVLGFSDVQANIAAQLVAQGIEVHIFNHRTVAGIMRMISVLGGMIGCHEKSIRLADQLASRVEETRMRFSKKPHRPRVYFEEWNDPLITGIQWVSELIEIAGGEDCFAELAREPLAKRREITSEQVIDCDPEIILASWCGKPFKSEQLISRPGWNSIRAIRNNRVHEIDSSIILQPGPAAILDGLGRLCQVIHA